MPAAHKFGRAGFVEGSTFTGDPDQLVKAHPWVIQAASTPEFASGDRLDRISLEFVERIRSHIGNPLHA